MTDLIAFAGALGSGKDEAAKPLLADGWVLVKMASPIRRALEALDLEVTYKGCHLKLNSVIRDIGFDEAKRSIPYVRHVMQRLGTEAGRDIHGENCWVDLARASIAEKLYTGQRVVCTDIRFPEEAQMVRSLGGIVVKIVRKGADYSEHASETELPQELWDWQIINDSSPETLHANVRSLLASCNEDKA